MLEFIKYVVGQFAEKSEEVEYRVTENEKTVDVLIILDESDMGKVIGRQGKLAKSLRTIVKAMAQKQDKKYNIEIKERGEV
ncbi:MAG: KH domain-containing protein [Clostridiales bacterium]|nr:KH domain-containing protein [Clostridiales bacterium]